jgi:hypothetical protein
MKRCQRNIIVYLDHRPGTEKAYLITNYKGGQAMLLARVIYEFTLLMFGELSKDEAFKRNLERRFKVGTDDCGNAFFFFKVAERMNGSERIKLIPPCFENRETRYLSIDSVEGSWTEIAETDYLALEKKRFEERRSRFQDETNLEVSASAHIG